MTLIELLVTMGIMAAGFAALITGFSTIERQVGSTSDDAQLVTLARQVADLVETQPSQGGLAYVKCSASSGSAYQSQLAAANIAGTDTITVLAVAHAQTSGSSHVVAPNPASVPLTAIYTCGSGPTDYGVQQIKFRVSSPTGNAVVRIVYKRWN